METRLSEEQRTALQTTSEPVTVVDEQTHTVYVLLRADQYEMVKPLLASDDLQDTYPAQWDSALRAGWDDPAMDDYNHYDEHRQPS